jgi:hypothetical protein
MTLYAAIDLHSNNSVLCVLDEADRIVFSKRLPNDLAKIEQALRGCPGVIQGIAIESTYNWYWRIACGCGKPVSPTRYRPTIFLTVRMIVANPVTAGAASSIMPSADASRDLSGDGSFTCVSMILTCSCSAALWAGFNEEPSSRAQMSSRARVSCSGIAW